jgi:NTP pyrophosphatase (non-canonical NTP hydrolase)
MSGALKEIIEHYGKENQLQMVVGEIGELLALFGKEAQGRASKEDWVEEIADVEIMLEQLKLIKDIDTTDTKRFKIARTLERFKRDVKVISRNITSIQVDPYEPWSPKI